MREKFEEFLKQYKDYIFNFAFNMIGDISLSEDIISSVIEKMLKKIDKGEITEAQLHISYICSAVKYKYFDQLRKNKVRGGADLKLLDNFDYEQFDEIKIKQIICLDKIFDDLKINDRDRKVFYVHLFSDEYSFYVAKEMNMNPITFRNIIYRVKMKLKDNRKRFEYLRNGEFELIEPTL